MRGGYRHRSFGLALLCVSGPAAGHDQGKIAEAIVAAAPLGPQAETHAEGASPVHDRTSPPSSEEEAEVDLSVVYTAEVMRNSRGGLRRGTRYLDNLDLTLRIDAEHALGWRGATLFAYALYNNGEFLSEDLVGAAQGVSNIETGVRALRLYEAWIEQSFASDRASLKLGLYDLNSEFDAIEAAGLFINPSHGIGPDFAQSGRNGPSIFPATSLALRGDYKISHRWIVRAALLDGVPGDPGRPRRTAIKLSGEEGALGVVEINYAAGRTRAGVGYWRYSGRFETFSGEPERSRGNDGLYAFVERRLTRERADDEQGLASWMRLGFADARLNPIQSYLGGGLTYTGPFPGRDKDQVGLALGWVEFGAPFRRSSALLGDPLNSREVIIEATYRAPVTRWLTLQPDLQYAIAPGGRSGTPNALIVGLRAEVGF